MEWVPPYTKSMTQYMDFTQNGHTAISDLNQMRSFVLFNRDRYWNPKLKQEFFQNLSGLWDATYYQEGIMKEDMRPMNEDFMRKDVDKETQERLARAAFPS